MQEEMPRLAVMPDHEKILRQTCEPVTEFGNKLKRLGNTMLAEMHRLRGVGLAGPQFMQPWRIFVYTPGGAPLVVVNPQILEHGDDRFEHIEGCLSLPGEEYRVSRHREILVQYQDVKGRQYRRQVTNLAAAIFQHELDHLNGVLISDHGIKIEAN